MMTIRPLRLAAFVSALVGAIALYACDERERAEVAIDRKDASAAVPSPTSASASAPWEIVREGDALIMTGDRPLRARFTKEATSIARKYDGARVSFHAKSIGRSALVALPPAEPSRVGERVQFVRSDVTEWYEQTVNGVEQGFTIAKRPFGAGKLHVDVAVGEEMRVTASKAPNELVLERRADDTPCFKYGALAVKDASGTSLVASMHAPDASTIRIEVDDTSATYPIVIDPLVWAFQTKLTRLEAKGQDQLGRGIAIANGDTIFVGMNGYQNFYGATAIFQRKGAQWLESPQLLRAPSLDNSSGDFGYTASASGSRVLVGAINTATVFVRGDAGAWLFEHVFLPPLVTSIPPSNGITLALSGDRAAVFTLFPVTVRDPNGLVVPPDDSGAVLPSTLFVYRRDATTWAEEARIVLPSEPRGFVYGKIALDKDTLAVGAGDRVYVYRRSGTAWQLEAAIAPTTGPQLTFGFVVLLENDRLVITDLDEATSIYERSGTTWTFVQKIDSPVQRQALGIHAAVAGDVIFLTSNVGTNGHSVLRFGRSGGVWTFEEEIRPNDIGLIHNFAGDESLATDGKLAVFGDCFNAVTRGAAYVYELRGVLGDACSTDEACHSGHCVDGVCCDTACGGSVEGDCSTCNRMDRRGICGPAPPSTNCRPPFSSECDEAEYCDGTSTVCPADRLRPNGTTCDAGVCVNGACQEATQAPIIAPAEAGSSTAPVDHGGCAVDSRGSTHSVAGAALLFAFAFALASRRRARLLVAVSVGVVLLAQPSNWADRTITLSSSAVRATISSTGARFENESAFGWWELELIGAGRGKQTDALARVIPVWEGTGALLDHGELQERYETTRTGIEQTIDLLRPPAGAGPVHLQLALTNARAEGSDRELAIVSNSAHFGFGDLRAWDASGRVLPISMSANGTVIDLTIDDANAMYPIVIDPLVWCEQQRFAVADAPREALFGGEVAIGETMALATQLNPGRVHVFVRDGKAWSRHGEIALPPDSGPPSVAMHEDLVAIGTPFVDDGIGAVNLYKRSGNALSHLGKLVHDGAKSPDLIGANVSLDGNTLIARAFHVDERGEDGSLLPKVHVFERTGDVWSERAILAPRAPQFGLSTAVSGTTIVVSAGDSMFQSLGAIGTSPPAVFFYERDAMGSWNLLSVEYDPNPSASHFGERVSVDGETVVIAAPFPRVAGPGPVVGGSAYVYKRTAGVWQRVQELRPHDSATYDLFGAAVIKGNRILVGAPGADGGRGALYLFERASASSPFLETRKFTDPMGLVGDTFANGDFASDMLVASAFGRNDARGEITFYYLGPQGEPCVTAEKCASGFCVDGMCCDSACGDGNDSDCLACSVAKGAVVDGTCGVVKAGRECRPRRPDNDCDVADVCDGTSTACSADRSLENGAACRGGAGVCIGGACSARLPTSSADAGAPSASPASDGGCAISRTPLQEQTGAAPLAALAGIALTLRRARKKCLKPRHPDLGRMTP